MIENIFKSCKMGEWKKPFQGDKNCCYLSVSMNKLERDNMILKCPYMENKYEVQVGRYVMYYSRCYFRKK